MRSILVCLFLFLVVGCKTNDPADASTRAVITKISGTAETMNHGAWEPLRVGQLLREGEQARTAADGQVDIRFSPHGGVMTVMPDSAIAVERLGPDGTNTQSVATIRLTRGRVVGDTLKLPKGSKVVIKTNGGSFAIP